MTISRPIGGFAICCIVDLRLSAMSHLMLKSAKRASLAGKDSSSASSRFASSSAFHALVLAFLFMGTSPVRHSAIKSLLKNLSGEPLDHRPENHRHELERSPLGTARQFLAARLPPRTQPISPRLICLQLANT